VVLDNGSSLSKVDFSGDKAPRSVFCSIVGHPRHNKVVPNVQLKDFYVGSEARPKFVPFLIKEPIEHGIVINWTDMERIWHHTFYEELHVDPAEHPMLLTEAPLNPKTNREKMIEIQFETFNVPSFYVGIQPVFSLYSSDCLTGIVLDSGYHATDTVPIYEGISLPHAINRLSLAGYDIIMWLRKMLDERFPYFSEFQRDIHEIKEKFAYVTLDFEAEFQKGTTTDDCTAIYTFFGTTVNVRKDLYANIVLSGGTTMFPGLSERIEKEISLLASPERKSAAWIGGSMLASLAIFPQMAITREEYKDEGKMIVHRKCIEHHFLISFDNLRVFRSGLECITIRNDGSTIWTNT
jgi:actin